MHLVLPQDAHLAWFINGSNSRDYMRRRPLLMLWGGILATGALLLTFSVLFLTTCAGFYRCNVVLHWPTILPAVASMVLAEIMIARTPRASVMR